MALSLTEIKLIERVICKLQVWCEKYLSKNAERGKIELAEIITDEPLRKVVETLQWHQKYPEAEKVKKECTKILRWVNTTNGIMSKNLDENPFIANDEQITFKLIGTLADIAQNARKETKRRIAKLIFYVTSAIAGFVVTLLGIVYYLWWLWTKFST